MDYFLNPIMSIAFEYSDPLFKLIYDKFLRKDLYLKITKEKAITENPKKYTKINWLYKSDIDNLHIEDENDTLGVKELTYFKNSVKFYKVYLAFTVLNLTAITAFLYNQKALKNNPIKMRFYMKVLMFMLFIETPYLVVNIVLQKNKDYLMDVHSSDIEKYKRFYKV
jgi:hypothetical protein